MNKETIKHIVLYFCAFIFIFSLSSVFIVKEFIGQARGIELQGEDMLNMQLALNNGNIYVEYDGSIIKDKDRKIYKIGDSGEEIRYYQEILFKLDFLRSSLDGDFGPMTEGALKEFQAFKGIKETGQLDIETQRELEMAEYRRTQ